jgi:O-antigen ligase
MTELLDRPTDFEPSHVGRRTYVTRSRLPGLDAAVVIGIMLGLLLLIPARLALPSLGALGRPAIILGDLMFCWWVLVRLTTYLTMIGPQPLRWAMLPLATCLLISYALGQLRGLTSVEANGADRTMLYFAAFAGVALMAADGIANGMRLNLVIKSLVVMGTFVAVIGLIQYVTSIDVTTYLNIPGLSSQADALGFEARGAGIRVASTTTHYIELGALMATILPFALHLTIFAKDRGQKIRYGLATIFIAGAVMATISRTGVIGVGIVLLILLPVWPWRLRYNILVMSVGLVAALAVAKPSMIGTMMGLFSDPTNNAAFTVREARYGLVWYYVGQRPWFGRGTGTYLPPQYQILDNQWLGFLISNGIIGVAAIGAVFISGVVLAAMALKRSESKQMRHLCAALISTQVMGLAVAATFDSLAFLTYATTLALTFGLCGTVWRLTHPAAVVRTSMPRWFWSPPTGNRERRSATPAKEDAVAAAGPRPTLG